MGLVTIWLLSGFIYVSSQIPLALSSVQIAYQNLGHFKQNKPVKNTDEKEVDLEKFPVYKTA